MKTLSGQLITPAERILWDYASGLIAYTTITPLCFNGAIAGSEFETYNAGKLYIALEIDLPISGYNATNSSLTLYNMANAIHMYYGNTALLWDGAAARYVGNSMQIKNQWFSRIVTANLTYFKFNGYKLLV